MLYERCPLCCLVIVVFFAHISVFILGVLIAFCRDSVYVHFEFYLCVQPSTN